MAAKKETCSKCGSSIFSVAKDKSNKHYCQAKGCGHVWVPGLEGLNRIDLQLKNALQENVDLKRELDKARKLIVTLREQLGEIQTTEEDVFS